jgi:head-tail adaptor
MGSNGIFSKNEKRAHYPRICNLIFVTKGKIGAKIRLSCRQFRATNQESFTSKILVLIRLDSETTKASRFAVLDAWNLLGNQQYLF